MAMTRRDFLRSTAAALGAGAVSALTVKPTQAGQASQPNVILILADDMGYSDAECYGGDVRTPNLAALAEGGLRFTQHYSTGRCWPSRACILTGYYAQHIRRDTMEGIELGNRPKWAPLLPEMLKSYGYTSYHSGKWHIDGTPIDGGFDRSWGGERTGCDWDRYFDSKPWKEDGVSAPAKPGEDYYSTVAIADRAIQCLKLHQSKYGKKPFFQYIAFYSPHFPLQAIQKDSDSYRDAYIEGWDVIRRRRWERMKKMGIVNCALSELDADTVPSWNLKPEQLKEQIGPGEAARAVAWNTLTDEQKRFQAAKMAIHAAMITRMDLEIGRVIQQLKEMGAYENTLILFASDNGASAEQIIRGDGHDRSAAMGSAETFLCLGPGFSTAANTPFRLHKHWNHEGGISSPFIAHWPKGIRARGELRHEPSHFIDIVPTILELAAAKADQPAGTPPRPGRSLIPVFKKDHALKERTLWWRHSGNRAIRQGDWKLSAKGGKEGKWELYDLSVDRCEMNDLALKYPQKVEQLAGQWQAIAEGFHADLNNEKSP